MRRVETARAQNRNPVYIYSPFEACVSPKPPPAEMMLTAAQRSTAPQHGVNISPECCIAVTVPVAPPPTMPSATPSLERRSLLQASFELHLPTKSHGGQQNLHLAHILRQLLYRDVSSVCVFEGVASFIYPCALVLDVSVNLLFRAVNFRRESPCSSARGKDHSHGQ